MKHSILNNIFPLRTNHLPSVGTDKDPAKETVSSNQGAVSLQHDFISFRPSLNDPLRPEVKIINPSLQQPRLIGDNQSSFQSPSEVTPIDMAVVGRAVTKTKVQKPKHQQQYSFPSSAIFNVAPQKKQRGKLKVPKETTPIDVAVFSHNILSPSSSSINTRPNPPNEVLTYKLEDAIKVQSIILDLSFYFNIF